MLEPKSEALTVEQCLAAYTINAAYGMHMEDKIGSLTVGKYADLVVLDGDCRVEAVFLKGRRFQKR